MVLGVEGVRQKESRVAICNFCDPIHQGHVEEVLRA
jgi:hypothetical protein